MAGEFAQGLAHQAGLQADVAVAHFTFDFGSRYQCGNRVDHHHIHTAAAYQHIADFQGLFAGVGLGNQQIFYFYTEFTGVNRIKCVFCINKGAGAAVFLALGNGFQAEGGFAGRFRAEDFDNTAARQTAHA